ncbi:MAG: RNA polymerase sigma factor [candidate division KSB1 bacterium]|nr:RNA polymerase sigma factor [candidate division KSB1 bacterium]
MSATAQQARKLSITEDSFPKELVDAACAGDGHAIEQLAARTINYLQAMLRYLQAQGSWRVADPDDATMEVVVRVLGRLHTYEARSSFSSWLRRIMLNYLKDKARQEQARRRAGQTVSLDGPTPGSNQGDNYRPLSDTIAGSDGRDIVAALDDEEVKFSPQRLVLQFLETVPNGKHVEIFRLRHLQGLSYREISDRLSVPLGAVGVTLKRMEEKFRAFVLPLWKEHQT